MDFNIVIPARMQSSRFPNKIMALINGKPMIQHTYEQAIKTHAKNVIIAVDNQIAYDAVKKFTNDVVKTKYHSSGTDRIATVARQFLWTHDEIIVNLQADEPTIPILNIHQVARDLHINVSCDVATLYSDISNEDDLNNRNIVKVIFNSDRHALYFSRSPLPVNNGNILGYRHIGLYAYRGKSLTLFSQLPDSNISNAEKLEQLNVLYHGGKIHLSKIRKPMGPAVDIPEDIALVEEYFNNN